MRLHRVRVGYEFFLAEKRVSLEMIQVDLMAGENLTPDFLKVNPRGILPVLLLDDGTCIDEVVAVCRYLEETHSEPRLMGTDAKSKAVIESRNRHMEIDGFLSVADALRNSAPPFAKRGLARVAAEVQAIPALVERGIAGIGRYFDLLERYLSQSRYVAGDQFTIADITALCVVDFAGWVKQSVPAHHAHTLRWYQEVSSRPSAKA